MFLDTCLFLNRLSNLLAYNCSQHNVIFVCFSVVFVVFFPLSFLFLIIWVLSLFLMVNVARDLLILFKTNTQLLVLWIFSIIFISIYLSFWYLLFPSTIDFFCSSVYNSFRWQFRLFIWGFLVSWRQPVSLRISPLVQVLLHLLDFVRLWFHCCLSWLISCFILSLIHWFFHSVFFNLHTVFFFFFFFFFFSFCGSFLVSYHCGQKRCLK